ERLDVADFGALVIRSPRTRAADCCTVSDAGADSFTSPHRSPSASPCRSPVVIARIHRAPFGHVAHRAIICRVSSGDGGSSSGRSAFGGVTLLTGLRGSFPRATAALIPVEKIRCAWPIVDGDSGRPVFLLTTDSR